MINFTSETTTTDIIEVIPGYDMEIIVYGMLCGIIILFTIKKLKGRVYKKNLDANIYTKYEEATRFS